MSFSDDGDEETFYTDNEEENFEELLLSKLDPKFVNDIKIASKLSNEVKDTFFTYRQYIFEYYYEEDYGEYFDQDETSYVIDIYIPSLKKDLARGVAEITRCLTKTRIFKSELYEKQARMMYHPSRVARLLEAGLLSFTDGNSFDDL
jgi:hypothetical protein